MISTQSKVAREQVGLATEGSAVMSGDRADWFYLRHGNVLMEQGQFQAALGYFAMVTDPQFQEDCAVDQAVCWLYLNQPEMALQVCDRALTHQPDHPQLWLFRGVALHRLGRFQEAYASYDVATQGVRGVRTARPRWLRLGWPMLGQLGRRVAKKRLAQRWVH